MSFLFKKNSSEFFSRLLSVPKTGFILPVILEKVHEKKMDELDEKFDKELEKAFIPNSYQSEFLNKISSNISEELKTSEFLGIIIEEDKNFKLKMQELYFILKKNSPNDEELKINMKKAKNFSQEMIDYLTLYHSALQNVVEGQREVLTNEDFGFEDGTTVRDRMRIFEEKLKEIAFKSKNSFKK